MTLQNSGTVQQRSILDGIRTFTVAGTAGEFHTIFPLYSSTLSKYKFLLKWQ